MESTAMVQALELLRSNFDKPPSDMEIIRHALAQQVARASGTEMPPLLNQEQRKAFVGKLDKLTKFLESEDGADAVELLMNTWAAFDAKKEEEPAKKATSAPSTGAP